MPPAGLRCRKLAIGESFAERLQQLDLGVGQIDEYDGYAVLGLRQRRGDSRTQRVLVLRRRSRKVGHGDGDVIEASDHLQFHHRSAAP